MQNPGFVFLSRPVHPKCAYLGWTGLVKMTKLGGSRGDGKTVNKANPYRCSITSPKNTSSFPSTNSTTACQTNTAGFSFSPCKVPSQPRLVSPAVKSSSSNTSSPQREKICKDLIFTTVKGSAKMVNTSSLPSSSGEKLFGP